jgi:hypothetical protein
MRIRHAVLTALCSTAVAVAVPTGTASAAPAAPAAAAAAPVTCFAAIWSVRDGRVGLFFPVRGVNTPIRIGPSTGCRTVGLGQPWHQVRLDCWTFAPVGPLGIGAWTHVLDLTNRVAGWVPSSSLVGGGARVHC